VAVINEAMARRFWGSTDVVGKRYRHDGQPDSWVEVVGVVANMKLTSVTEEPQPQVYRSVDQQPWPVASFLVRTAANPADVVGTMAAAIRGLDPRLPVMQLVTMDDHIDQQLLLPRMGAGVLTGFSFTALVLAALGLYAVVAFAVGERTREIGIRIALGARGSGVVWTVIRGILLTVAAGVAVGLIVAIAAAQAMSSVLFDVSPTDPATLFAVSAVLALVAIVAACVPAMRAMRVDPATVLRYQ
jgi:ABC-type antimicrobial peptide transport system permease subunit